MKEKEKESKNVFANKNFRLCFFGALVSELGATLYSFAVGFYILEISGNNALLQGTYLAVCAAMLLVFTPIGGVLGDRYNKAKIMYICDYLKGSIIIAGTLFMIMFKESDARIIVLFAIGILGNAVSGVFNPAAGAIFPSIVDEDKLQQANSYFSVKSAAQNIFGIILAGILYTSIPIIALFIIVGVCYILSGVSEMFIKYTHKSIEEKMSLKLVMLDIKEGLQYVNMQHAIRAMIIITVFINFFITPVIGNFIPYFIRTDVANAPSYLLDGVLKPELWNSLFFVLMGISTMVGAIALSARQQDEKIGHKLSARLCLIAVMMVLTALGYWLLVARGLSLNGFLVAFSIASFIFGILIVSINIPASTAFMRIVDKDKLSKVMSILSFAGQGLAPVASVLAGAILQYSGSANLLFICAMGFTITAIFALFNKNVKNI